MDTVVDEVAPDIFRLSTYLPAVDLQFNQFLVRAEEPLLFHTGYRLLFPTIRDALARVIDPLALRWISFGHVEADECGAMNEWLSVAPSAQVVHGRLGVMVSLGDLADRPPRALAEGEVLDLGRRRVRWIDTAHVPHGWDSGLLLEETTGTLLCGDLFTATGPGPAVSGADPVGPALAAEDRFGATALTPGPGRPSGRSPRPHPRRSPSCTDPPTPGTRWTRSVRSPTPTTPGCGRRSTGHRPEKPAAPAVDLQPLQRREHRRGVGAQCLVDRTFHRRHPGCQLVVQRPAAIGEQHQHPAAVGVVGPPVDQPAVRQPVDDLGQGRCGHHRVCGDLRHRVPGVVGEQVQHPPGVQARPVRRADDLVDPALHPVRGAAQGHGGARPAALAARLGGGHGGGLQERSG